MIVGYYARTLSSYVLSKSLTVLFQRLTAKCCYRIIAGWVFSIFLSFLIRFLPLCIVSRKYLLELSFGKSHCDIIFTSQLNFVLNMDVAVGRDKEGQVMLERPIIVLKK